MGMKFMSWQTALGSLISFIVLLFAFGFTVFISTALVSMAIVPITWAVGRITGQSYARVCDNSEIVYKLNRFGQWSMVISIGLLICYGIFHINYRP